MTYERLLLKRERAINFVRNVLQDEDHAEMLEDESPEDYAARKRIVIDNHAKDRLSLGPSGRGEEEEPEEDE